MIVPWVVKQVGITWGYTVTVKNHPSSFSGSGWMTRQITRANRNYKRGQYPNEHTDMRYRWAKTYEIKSVVEYFIFILAHEACHAKRMYDDKTGKRDFVEFHCDDCAYKVVQAYRAEQKDPARLRRALRKERLQRKQAKDAVGYTKTPEYKLSIVQAHLKSWTSKKKRAESMIRKYQRKINYYTAKIQKETL